MRTIFAVLALAVLMQPAGAAVKPTDIPDETVTGSTCFGLARFIGILNTQGPPVELIGKVPASQVRGATYGEPYQLYLFRNIDYRRDPRIFAAWFDGEGCRDTGRPFWYKD